jgi:hypothetical protein
LAKPHCVADAHGLSAEPFDDFDDAAEAHSALLPALEAWSATSELIDITPLAFELQGSSFEDIGPDGQDGASITAHAMMETITFTDVVAVAKNRLPLPHDDIRKEGPVAAQLRCRWRNVVRGTESPIMVAYFIQTTIEEHVGRPEDVPDALNISTKVWKKLSRLASTEDPVHGRKAKARPGPLTDADVHWIRYACPLIIRRVLEYQAEADISYKITNADLPQSS